MKEVKIDLLDPIVGHGGKVKQIVLREPRYSEVMQLGEPVVRAWGLKGEITYQSENIEVIRAYVAALLVRGKEGPQLDADLLDQLSLADTLRVKDAVLGFFMDVRLKLSAGVATS